MSSIKVHDLGKPGVRRKYGLSVIKFLRKNNELEVNLVWLWRFAMNTMWVVLAFTNTRGQVVAFGLKHLEQPGRYKRIIVDPQQTEVVCCFVRTVDESLQKAAFLRGCWPDLKTRVVF